MSVPRRPLDPSGTADQPVVDTGTDEVDATRTGSTAADFAAAGTSRATWARRAAAAGLLATCGAVALGLALQGPTDQTTAAPTPSATATAEPLDVAGLSRSAARAALDPALATPAPQTPSASATSTPSVAPRPRPSAEAPAATRSAAPTKAARPTGKPTTRPSAAAPATGRPAGTRWARIAVNVRTAPSTDASRIGLLAEGTKVAITDRTTDGWRQVVVDGRTGWVRAAYLTTEAPAAKAAPAAEAATAPDVAARQATASKRATATPAAPRRASVGRCASTAVEDGLSSGAIAVHRAICGAFPSVTAFGGYRAGDMEHGTGRALDAMVSGEAGWEVARWARAHAGELGITQVIYSQQIWTTQRAGEGWRPMNDRGSTTANHYDHVHITVS